MTRRVAVLFAVTACARALLVPTPRLAARVRGGGGGRAASRPAACRARCRGRAAAARRRASRESSPTRSSTSSSRCRPTGRCSTTARGAVRGPPARAAREPETKETNCFLAYTPTRPDYSSLGSFGTRDTSRPTIVSTARASRRAPREPRRPGGLCTTTYRRRRPAEAPPQDGLLGRPERRRA